MGRFVDPVEERNHAATSGDLVKSSNLQARLAAEKHHDCLDALGALDLDLPPVPVQVPPNSPDLPLVTSIDVEGPEGAKGEFDLIGKKVANHLKVA
jgi:hypothetical protein